MASGQTLLILGAANNQMPPTNPATLDHILAATGVREFLDFDSSTNEVAIFGFVMPTNYGANGITLELWGAMDSANTATKVVQMEAAFERVETGIDLGGANDFAANNEDGETTVNNTADALFKSTITFTDGADMDSVVAGDVCRLKVIRNNTTGGTNATGDYQLLQIHMMET